MTRTSIERPAESWPLPGAGRTLRISPLRPEDTDLLVRFGLALGPETRYQRFLGGGMRLTPALLERLLLIDAARDLALIATVKVDELEVPVGVARYAGAADGRSAEFAITIADRWQGCGIGRILLERLVALARERGVTRLIGDTFAANEPMLRLARALGFAVRPHPDGATLRRLDRDLEDEYAAFIGRSAPPPRGDPEAAGAAAGQNCSSASARTPGAPCTTESRSAGTRDS